MRYSFILLLLISLSLPVMTSAQEDTAVASLEPFAEVIEILPAGETEWQPVTEPIVVHEGDQIRTDAGGWALLTYFEGVSTEILPETELTVTTLDLPSEEGDSFNVSLQVVAGETFNVVDTVLDQDSSFEVSTDNATAAVRGTRFYVSYDPETEQSGIGVEEGTVYLYDPEDLDAEPFEVEEGYYIETDETGDFSEVSEEWEAPERPEATCDPATDPWCSFSFDMCDPFVDTWCIIEVTVCDPSLDPACDPAADLLNQFGCAADDLACIGQIESYLGTSCDLTDPTCVDILITSDILPVTDATPFFDDSTGGDANPPTDQSGTDSSGTDQSSGNSGSTDSGSGEPGSTDPGTGGTDGGSTDGGGDAGGGDMGGGDAGGGDAGGGDAGGSDPGGGDMGGGDAGGGDAGGGDAGGSDPGGGDPGGSEGSTDGG